MAILTLGSGSVVTANVREAFSKASPEILPHFVIRVSHDGPIALTTLALENLLLLDKVISTSDAWITVPISNQLTIGQRLGWTVFAGFKVPKLGAYLVIQNQVKFLGLKKNLSAGGLWATQVFIKTHHLS